MKKFEKNKAKFTVSEAVASAQRSAAAAASAISRSRSPGFRSPAAVTGIYARVSEKLGNDGEIGSAVAEAAAKARAKSVLKELNHGAAPTPPWGSMSVPKLKSVVGGAGAEDRPAGVLESLRRRQTFENEN